MDNREDALLAVTERRLGRRIGPYLLERVVGIGGVSTTYAAVRPDGAHVAVRVLHPDIAEVEGAVSAFLHESKDANRVGHGGAVRVLETGDAGDDAFVVMALLEGQSIAARAAQRGGQIRAADVARIADAVLEVVASAHDHDVVHGDLVADNLLLTPRGLRVLDFGVATVRRLAAANGRVAHFIPRAPDAWSGPPPSATGDLAAVGAMMAGLVTGQRRLSPGAVVNLPADLVDPAVAEVIQIALSTTAARGFASASEMRAALSIAQQRAAREAPRSMAPPGLSMPPPAPSQSQAMRAVSVPPPSQSQGMRAVSIPPSSQPQARSFAPPPPSSQPQAARSFPPPSPPKPRSLPPPSPSQPRSFAPPAPQPQPGRSFAPPAPQPQSPRGPAIVPAVPAYAPPPVFDAAAAARAAQPPGPGPDAEALRAFLASAARCLASGSLAVAFAIRFEMEALSPAGVPESEAQAAREAARPEAARWLARAYEGAVAAITAGGGAVAWQVTARAFEVHGHPVWQPHGPLERLPVHLAASGVRAIGLRRGLMVSELGELLRLLAAAVEGDPRVGEDLAGVLWEADLPHVTVEADDDPLGPLDGEPAPDLLAERTLEIAELSAWDAEAFEKGRSRWTGRGAMFVEVHERMMEALTLLPASGSPPAAPEAGKKKVAVPRAQALVIHEEIRRALAADLGADPVAEAERAGFAAARAWQASGAAIAVGEALRGAVERLTRAAPLSALGLVHAACEALVTAEQPEPAVGQEFDLAVDLGGGGAPLPPRTGDAPERAALARAVVTPEALERILTAAPLGGVPSPIAAGRARALLDRLGDGYATACLDAFPRITDPLVREAVGARLSCSGEAILASIAAVVPTIDVEPAIVLLRALATVGSRAAHEAVVAGTRSPHGVVRVEALGLVEGPSSERARVELAKMLDDRDPTARVEALRRIAQSHVRIAGPHLALHARGEGFDDLPADERRAVFTTLATLLPSRAVEICLEHVQKGALIPRPAQEETREIAAELLGYITTSFDVERALAEVAERRFRNTERTRAAARAAAKRIAERRAVSSTASVSTMGPALPGGPR